MEQGLEGGAGPYGEAANRTVFTGGSLCGGLPGADFGGRGGGDDGVVGGQDACVTGHYDVEDCGAGEGRGRMGGAEIFFLMVGIEASIAKAGMRTAGARTVRVGGSPRVWNGDGRQSRAVSPGDVGDVGNEAIGGAEEFSERAGVVLARTVGLHDVFGTVADLLLHLEETC